MHFAKVEKKDEKINFEQVFIVMKSSTVSYPLLRPGGIKAKKVATRIPVGLTLADKALSRNIRNNGPKNVESKKAERPSRVPSIFEMNIAGTMTRAEKKIPNRRMRNIVP